MAKQNRPSKRVKNRTRSGVPGRVPNAVPRRRQWWPIGVVLVMTVTGVVVWQTMDRSDPVAPMVSPQTVSSSVAPLHINTMLDAYTQKMPESVVEIQQEEVDLVQAMVQDFPKNEVPLVLMATVVQYRGDTTQAEVLWKQALDLNPTRSDLYLKLGQAAQGKDQLDEAITWWQQGLKANPKATELQWEIANALMTQDHLDSALGYAQAECAIAPSVTRNHYLLGQIYLKQRVYDKAEAAYNKAIALDPNYFNAYYGLGMVYTRLKQPTQAKAAMAHFQKIKAQADASTEQQIMIDELPYARKRITASYTQAYSLYDPKQQKEIGERLLKRALALDPEDAHLWEKLAGRHYLKGQFEQALQVFEKVVSLDPNNPLPRINIGKLYTQMNQLESAEAALRETVSRFPDSGLAHAELARLYLQAQTHSTEALSLMKKAVAMTPTANNYFLLTWAFDVNGDVTNAMNAIQKALELEPQNRQYRGTYERIQTKL